MSTASVTLSEQIGQLLSPELLRLLDELLPLSLPNPNDPPSVMWFKVGQRSMIETLHAKYAEVTDPS